MHAIDPTRTERSASIIGGLFEYQRDLLRSPGTWSAPTKQHTQAYVSIISQVRIAATRAGTLEPELAGLESSTRGMSSSTMSSFTRPL
jgi:hypothetical protein